MKIAVACDHGGFPLKETILEAVRAAGHEPIDLGTDSAEPVDFPDFTEKLGRTIQKGEAERGILVCGSGVGACIAANKMKGVWASICHDTYSAAQGVEHRLARLQPDRLIGLRQSLRRICPDSLPRLVP